MINQDKWFQFSLAQQLGNIGSELARARYWEEKQDSENRDQALMRALDLLDLTLGDSRWRLRFCELARLREVVGDWYSGLKNYHISPKELEDYCVSFTLTPFKG